MTSIQRISVVLFPYDMSLYEADKNRYYTDLTKGPRSEINELL